MKQTVFIVVNAQNGECRMRKTPAAAPWEYIFQLDLEIPSTPIPLVTIKIPVPAAPAVVTEIMDIPFGVPWALSQGIVKVTGLDEKGVVLLDYTDEGISRLLSELAVPPKDCWALTDYARKKYGIPLIYLEPERWQRLTEKPTLEEGSHD
jgi:hypothetical protein